MSLASLGLLFMPSAQAQGPGGYWAAVPCDASGNLLSNPSYNNDGYVMGGTESGTDSTTCPLFHSYDTASTTYSDVPTPSGIGNYGSGGNEALVTNGNSYFWYGQIYGTNTYATQNGTEIVDLNGQLVYYFKEVWQGSGAPTTPMPSYIDVRLKTTVSAFAYLDFGSASQTSVLSAQATASDGDPFNETASASVSSPDVPVLSQGAGAYHLVRASVSGGIATVYLNGTVHMEADNTIPFGVLSYPMPGDPSYVEPTATNGPTQARSSSLVAGSVRPDNREVMITCPTIEDSYYKATNPDPTHGDRYKHLRDPITGAIVTDSAVTYQKESTVGLGGASGTGTAKGWQVNNIPFTANAANFNSPTYQWSLSGPSEASLALSTANPVNYSLLEPNSDKFPLQGTLKVTVTGDDGASAANTFGITWHLPYEENAFLGTVYTKHKRGAARVGPVDYGSTVTVKAEGAEDVDVSAVFDAGEAITAIAGQEEFAGLFKIASSLAKITNAKYTYGPENTDFGVSNQPDSGNWENAGREMKEKYAGEPNISPASLASDPDGQSLCHLYWYDIEKDADSSWYADGYNIHGYDGNSTHTIFVRQCVMIEGQPFFVKYKNKDGSPYPGT